MGLQRYSSSTTEDSNAPRCDTRLRRGLGATGELTSAGTVWLEVGQRICCAVAHHPSTLAAVVAALADGADLYTYQAIATNPNTPSRLLTHSGNHPNTNIVIAAAANPITPPDTLAGLSSDPDLLTRRIAAGNPNRP